MNKECLFAFFFLTPKQLQEHNLPPMKGVSCAVGLLNSVEFFSTWYWSFTCLLHSQNSNSILYQNAKNILWKGYGQGDWQVPPPPITVQVAFWERILKVASRTTFLHSQRLMLNLVISTAGRTRQQRGKDFTTLKQLDRHRTRFITGKVCPSCRIAL